MYWGLSESLDLYEEYIRAFKGLPEQDEFSAASENEQKPQQNGKDNNFEEAAEKINKDNEKEENEECAGLQDENQAVINKVHDENKLEETLNLPMPEATLASTPTAESTTAEPAPTPPSPRKLNILLFGASDPRHIIHTIAKLHKHEHPDVAYSSSIELNFYMLDGSSEIVARNMLLLSIALEQPEYLNLHTKVHLFMDVYGNSMTRPSTHQYVIGKAKSLLNICTDDEIMAKIAPILNIEGLKYRERDGLEKAFTFWLPKAGHVFNIEQYWEDRNRKLLTIRYDHRNGAFDWDLCMILKNRGAEQICSQEYRHWRDCGIAFTYPEYEQCKPNKTLSAMLIRNGDKFHHRGYVGDIQSGPFCCFGIKCADVRMKHSQHGENDYRATDITERNLLEYFYELQQQKPYEHDLEQSRRYGSTKLLTGKTLKYNEYDMDALQSYNKPWLRTDGVHINFLSQEDVFALQQPNGRWHNFFDIAFVGHNYFAFLQKGFIDVLRENALLILETKLWTVGRNDDVNAFDTKLKDYAKNLKLTPVINYGAINSKYSTLKFKKILDSTVKTDNMDKPKNAENQ